ncbi:MAG TPA: hypothetical protein PKD54_11185 [Pirellulaceae bacterium]|nr:hypothetical protein [Pirellulaceae bacterium]
MDSLPSFFPFPSDPSNPHAARHESTAEPYLTQAQAGGESHATSQFQAATQIQAAAQGTELSQREVLLRHLAVSRYGDFELTEAVRPAMNLQVCPRQGYRHDIYVDPQSQSRIPVIMAAVSSERLFSVFVELVQRLGPSVDVVLESSHDHEEAGHIDYYREQIDMPVLLSALWDFEDLLLNDGCTGVAALNPATPQEIQLDEHKLLIIYGSPLEVFEHILEKHGVMCDEGLHFITEAEHIHSTSDQFVQRFHQFRTELGLDSSCESLGSA